MIKVRKYLVYVVAILFLILITTNGFTLAKYVTNSVWNYYLNSQDFYFTSPELNANKSSIVNNLWQGEPINFKLQNSLNDELVTEYDITYQVTCTVLGDASSIATCKINGTDSNVYNGTLSNFKECVNDTGDGVDVSSYNKTDCEINGYHWLNNQVTSNLYFELEKTTDVDIESAVVNITATSTSPFKKTLSAEYTLHKDQSLVGMINKTYTEFTDYSSLVISNSYDTDKCLSIKWDSSKLRYDLNEQELMSFNTDTNGYINEIVIKVQAKNSQRYIFYKTNLNEAYDNTIFALTELSECP